MANLPQMRRLKLFSVFLLLGFAFLLGRLVYIQIVLHDELRDKASRYSERTYVKQTRRGDIFDRNGLLLAGSQRLKILCADPSRIGKYYRPLGKTLAKYLEEDEEALIERLRPKEHINSAGVKVIDPHVRLRVRVTGAEWEALSNLLANMKVEGEDSLPEEERKFLKVMRRKAIFAESLESYRRSYLNGQLAAHVLGFVQTRERTVRGQPVFYAAGQMGVEKIFDKHLQGTLGWRTTETDSRRRELVAFRSMEVDARAGLDIHLTIDSGVQAIVEEELAKGVERSDPMTATVVVVQPRTGEILALANYPTFDPNRYGEFPVANRRNRAISDQFEPGSTFKTISVAAALDQGVTSIDTMYDCENGYIRFMGKALRDDHRYGMLSTSDIVKKSSNIGTFKIVRELGVEKLYRSLKQFGIGTRSGITLTSERSGLLRKPDDWSGLSISRIPIGYEVAVTPLQITMAVAAIANGGWLMRPRIVRHLSDEDGKPAVRFSPEVIRRAISEKAAREMTGAMETVVEQGGTATRAKLKHYTVAGKTGTARKFVPNVGYTRTKYYASFIGFLPSEKPELVISVIFNEPKGSIYGGVIAGPVFREIARRTASYLDIRPSSELIESIETPRPMEMTSAAAGVPSEEATRP